MLREPEREPTRLLETIVNAFQLFDAGWHITHMNSVARTFWQAHGMNPESMIGKHFWTELFPESRDGEAAAQMCRAMEERVSVSFDYFHEPWDVWLRSGFDPLPDGGLANYFHDITERPPIVGQHDMLAQLRLEFDRMPVACVVTDARRRIVEWNAASEVVFGHRRDEVVGRDGFDVLLPSAARDEAGRLVERLASGDMSAHAVNENLTKDGRTIICEWHNTPLRNADGAITAYLSMAQDVTERIRAEAALRESEARYRSLVSQVKDYAIFSTDAHGVVTTWSEGCQQVLGYTQKQFVALDGHELFTPEDRAAGIMEHYMRVLADTGTLRDDRWMLAKGGRRFFGMGAVAARRDTTTGKLLGYSVVIRDVTEMRLTQEALAHRGEHLERLVSERTSALERAIEQLRLSERMASLGTLAAGLGHDLGNLLLPLDARLQMLRQADLPDDLREHVAGIESCVHYLRRLSGGLRLLATSPGSVQPFETTELGEWWEEVGPLLKNVLPYGVVFERDVPRGGCWVAIGRVPLTQAVFNLVQNAADAVAERGGPGRHVRVSVEDEQSTDAVTIRVSDDGPGMTEEVARRCMEPYFSTKVRDVSTGMGLALVRALVNGVGGRVEIESTLGAGTTVSLVLHEGKERRKARAARRRAARSQERQRVAALSGLRADVHGDVPPAPLVEP
ncbi:MAG TPA: PAS domain-containing sensor histidine kinase [Gemmatimonadaceae bacterium]